ncbi:hypothetical protein AB9C31_20475 [Enterobacter cloacae]|uniref:hypothetical protein n=1 Tax=Enterobacter cloacae complex TaxID=354276 RepID=UPI00350FFA0E
MSVKQKFIEWFTRNNNGCSPAMEDDRSFVSEKAQHMFEAYWAGVAEGEARCVELAAENAGLKAAINEHSQCFTVCKCCGTENDCSNDDICRAVNEVPETDAFLAEVRASVVEEFVRMADYSESVADGEVIVTSNSVFAAGHEFAAQIRKGVQS